MILEHVILGIFSVLLCDLLLRLSPDEQAFCQKLLPSPEKLLN